MKVFLAYGRVLGVLLLAALINALAPWLISHMQALPGSESALALSLWCLTLFLGFGWACSKAAEGTIFPGFTLQLLAGIVLHDALSVLSTQVTLAVVVCTLLAAVILKSGGDEIERRSFMRIAWPTLLIAVLGYLITFVITLVLLSALGLDLSTAALLAAILGSTDPAALIPTLKQLTIREEHRSISDLSISESALNDAVGAIFTTVVLGLVLSGAPMDSAGALLKHLVSPEPLMDLGQQFALGTLAGVLGWAALYLFERYKHRQHLLNQAEPAYDFAIALGAPLGTFMLAQWMHGNGFLAAFIAGLLGNFNRGSPSFHGLIHSMETKIESVAKPSIFMMVGPFVSLADLMDTAWLGAGVSLLFMGVARPLAVMISLSPTRMPMKQKWFMCVVRETGVIPVVLAVMVASQIPEARQLLPLTAWVVIWTLTLLPAITPWWARRLDLLE